MTAISRQDLAAGEADTVAVADLYHPVRQTNEDMMICLSESRKRVNWCCLWKFAFQD
jgi:hypothetical protein